MIANTVHLEQKESVILSEKYPEQVEVVLLGYLDVHFAQVHSMVVGCKEEKHFGTLVLIPVERLAAVGTDLVGFSVKQDTIASVVVDNMDIVVVVAAIVCLVGNSEELAEAGAAVVVADTAWKVAVVVGVEDVVVPVLDILVLMAPAVGMEVRLVELFVG